MKWSVHLTLRCICWNGCGLPVKYTTEKWSWDSTFDTRVWTNHPDGYKAKKEKKKKEKKRKEKNPSCCCRYDCVIPSPGTTRISSQPSDWCWICCASVTPAVVTTEPQRKHTSHFTAILITLNMRPQESSAHFTLCFVLFFSPTCYGPCVAGQGRPHCHWGAALWVRGCDCWRSSPRWSSPVVSTASVTHITSRPLAGLFISLQTHGVIMWRPHWHFKGCVIILLWHVERASQRCPHGIISAKLPYYFQ